MNDERGEMEEKEKKKKKQNKGGCKKAKVTIPWNGMLQLCWARCPLCEATYVLQSRVGAQPMSLALHLILLFRVPLPDLRT